MTGEYNTGAAYWMERARRAEEALWVLDGHARLYMTLASNVDRQVREVLDATPPPESELDNGDDEAVRWERYGRAARIFISGLESRNPGILARFDSTIDEADKILPTKPVALQPSRDDAHPTPEQRFGHHADPVIDFCVEVECLESIAADCRRGLRLYSELQPRLDRALEFRVGGDDSAVRAKDRLRALKQSLTTTPAEQTGDALAALERLRSGREIVMPVDRYHAKAMVSVGMRYLDDNGGRHLTASGVPSVCPDCRDGSGSEVTGWYYQCDQCGRHWKEVEQDSGVPDWTPSGGDYDRSIHSNPDHEAWADFFMQTFPNCGADRDTMAGWFANAMMAKHDSMPDSGVPENEFVNQLLGELERRGVDTSNWDSEEGLTRAIADGVATAIKEADCIPDDVQRLPHRMRSAAKEMQAKDPKPGSRLSGRIDEAWVWADELETTLASAPAVPDGMRTAWPTRDILTKLADAADILLDRYNHDDDGWEMIAHARDVARERATAPTHGGSEHE